MYSASPIGDGVFESEERGYYLLHAVQALLDWRQRSLDPKLPMPDVDYEVSETDNTVGLTPISEIPTIERLVRQTEVVAGRFALVVPEGQETMPLSVMLEAHIEVLEKLRNRALELGW